MTGLSGFAFAVIAAWLATNTVSAGGAADYPFMQRLDQYGIAMHAGVLPGYPASHGCIRLPAAVAKRLYGMTRLGDPVDIES